MARSKNTSSIYFDGFKGIDRSKTHNGKETTSVMENFRITEDGTLKKRGGYQPIVSDDNVIIAVWSGEIRMVKRCFYFTNNREVYSFDPEARTSTLIGILPHSSPFACFFFYQEALYLKNDTRIYLVTDAGVTESTGYVPLYGKDWGTSEPGEVYQKRNLMHRILRISYKIPQTHTAMLPTRETISSVIALYRNGVLVPEEGYFIDSRFNTIKVTEIEAGDEFLAIVELPKSAPYFALYKTCRKVSIFSGINGAEIYMWGATYYNTLLSTTFVSEEDVEASEAVCPGYGSFYITEDNVIKLSEGGSMINALVRKYDKLLICSRNELWQADPSLRRGMIFPTVNISPYEGCQQLGAYAIANNVLYTVGSTGIIQWDINTSDPSRSSMKVISNEIQDMLSKNFLKNASLYYYYGRNELLLFNSSYSLIFVYDIEKKYWYSLTGFSPYGFFEFDGKLFFHERGDVYCFTDDLDNDLRADGTERSVIGRFESGILSFGTTNRKRLCEGKVIGDFAGGTFYMDITCDTGETVVFPVYDSDEHKSTVTRLNSGRFSNLKFTFTCTGKAGMSVHSVKLVAQTKE